MSGLLDAARHVSWVALASLLSVAWGALAEAASSVSGDNTLRSPTRVTSTLDARRQTSFLVTGGVQQRNNLYHSFNNFRLEAGDSAILATNLRPAGSAPVQNVIARVTGGRPSEINGRVKFTTNPAAPTPGVDFYLINPAGVTLGPRGAVATAGEFFLNQPLPRGMAFPTTTTSSTGRGSATLTVAAPASFGFVPGNTRAPVATGSGSGASTGTTGGTGSAATTGSGGETGNTGATTTNIASGTSATGSSGGAQAAEAITISGQINGGYFWNDVAVVDNILDFRGRGTINISGADFQTEISIKADRIIFDNSIMNPISRKMETRIASNGRFAAISVGEIIFNGAVLSTSKGNGLIQLISENGNISSINSTISSDGNRIAIKSALVRSIDSRFVVEGSGSQKDEVFNISATKAVALNWGSFFDVKPENGVDKSSKSVNVVRAPAIFGPRDHFRDPIMGFTISGDSFNVEAALAPRAFLFFDRANLSRPCSGRNGSARASIANGGRGALPLGPERALLASHLDYLKSMPAPPSASLGSASAQRYQDPGYWRMNAECDTAV